MNSRNHFILTGAALLFLALIAIGPEDDSKSSDYGLREYSLNYGKQ